MYALELRGVEKAYRVPKERHTTLAERALGAFRTLPDAWLQALDGVDLAVEKGSFVGIIGPNGSGKSTLLKIMAGLLEPDAGELHVRGSLSALLELGLGFSPELTVRENVELYAAVLGYPRRELDRRIEGAIAFAELEEFRRAKLKNLSTGMKMRLGFATALQAESDILLLDEILAVGDARFQRKCLGVFDRLKQERKTVILVSHGLDQIRRFCDWAAFIDKGRIRATGDPDEVIQEYLEVVREAEKGAEIPPSVQIPDGQPVRYREGWLENMDGQRIGRIRSGERGVLVLLLDASAFTEQPTVGVVIVGEDGTEVGAAASNWYEAKTCDLREGETLEVRIEFLAALRNGQYTIRAGASNSQLTMFYEIADGLMSFVVYGSRCESGAADLQAVIRCGIRSSTESAGREARGGNVR